MCYHGRNLACFVAIYKSICCLLRNMKIYGGIESWIAGGVGGYYAFGDSAGVSGGVNNQIVLYLFARGIEGISQSFVRRGWLPSLLNLRSPKGFRLFAAFSLALALYLTEYEPETLRPGFMSTMNFLYYDSDKPNNSIPLQFSPFFVVSLISLLGVFYPKLSMENILANILGS